MTNFGTYSRLRFDVEASLFPGVVDERLTLVNEEDAHFAPEDSAFMTFAVN